MTLIPWRLVLAVAAAGTPALKVDQAGYLPVGPKVAFLAGAGPARDFSVHRAGDGGVVFRGSLTAAVTDADSGDSVQAADFTAVREAGRYYLEVPGAGRSWEFVVGPGAYDRALYLAARAFYGQRCGTEVDLGPAVPGYRHSACHQRGAYHPSSGRSGPHPSARGWHDAGDYGRYVVNSAISTGTLLWASELFGARLADLRLDIPESGGRTPDLLSEARWNLDWMLDMQDEDGGVWPKQTSERFPAFVMPEQDASISYVVGTGAAPFKSSCATADFAAVMAVAGRVYRPFDAPYAERTLSAARRAWSWVAQHPSVAFQNPAGVETGSYADDQCGDEALWAAAELWRTTGDEGYHRYFLDHQAAFQDTLRPVGPPSWRSVGALGLWTYLLSGRADPAVAGKLRAATLAAADAVVERTRRHPYHLSLAPADYVWGSNGVAANYGMQLLVAHALGPNPLYVEAALDDLHYLLGRNAFSLSWVTQVGAHPFRHPHHRPSGADTNSEPWPGLLSGGPNQKRQDPALKSLPDLPPARMYLDEEASYASNEIAINWNAPLVFLLAGVRAPP